MNSTRFWLGFAVALLLGATDCPAQQRFRLKFVGSFWTTNATGQKFVSSHANTKTWLREYGLSQGLTNTANLALAYHVNGGEQGDTIEVIDAATGNFVNVLYGLYLGTFFDRMPVVSADGTQVKLLQYVFSQQNAYPVGSALISERFFLDRNGNTNRTVIQGELDFLVLPDPAHKAGFYTGTFVTGKALN